MSLLKEHYTVFSVKLNKKVVNFWLLICFFLDYQDPDPHQIIPDPGKVPDSTGSEVTTLARVIEKIYV